MATRESGFLKLGRWFGLWMMGVSLPAVATVVLAWYWLQASAAGALPSYWQYVLGGLLLLTIVLALLAAAFVRRAVVRPLEHLTRHLDAISSGDLTQRIESGAAGGIGDVLGSLRRLQDNLNRLLQGVRNGMAGIASGKQEIVAGNTDLGSRTELQASALQETVVSMEQLSSTVRQNADNARQANQLASMASDVAHRGGSAVGDVVATMNDISASSKQISDIVGVIDSIAFQTNILALNAAVEAARAGEQGKGFAVVASEVRALAQRSAQAAREIKTLIEDSVRKVSEGSGQVETAGATMQEIVESVAKVTDIMGEISAATTEQASGIDEINRAISRMDEMTRNNASLVQQEALAIATLDKDVTQVFQSVSGYRTLDGRVIDVTAASLPSPATARGLTNSRSSNHGQTQQKPRAISATTNNKSSTNGREQLKGVQRTATTAQAASSAGAGAVRKRTSSAAAAPQPTHRLPSKHATASDDDDWVEF